jgi:hypothetical protein
MRESKTIYSSNGKCRQGPSSEVKLENQVGANATSTLVVTLGDPPAGVEKVIGRPELGGQSLPDLKTFLNNIQ